MPDFEDGLRTGTKLEVRNGLQSVRTIPEVNMVSPLGLSMTLGAVWRQKVPVLESRQTNVQLAEFRASVVLNYSCCGVRIELA